METKFITAIENGRVYAEMCQNNKRKILCNIKLNNIFYSLKMPFKNEVPIFMSISIQKYICDIFRIRM